MKPDWRDDLEKEFKVARRIVILGVGNSQRGDDAVGGLVIGELKSMIGKRKGREISLLEGGRRRRA